WNQALLLALAPPAAAPVLRRGLTAPLLHHDALRLPFPRHAARGWGQPRPPPGGAPPSPRVRLLRPPPARPPPPPRAARRRRPALESVCARLQASLDLGRGPLLRAASFALGGARRHPRAGAAERLLLACHHLAVDGVSWRILLEDLETSRAQVERGEPIRL